MVVITLIVVILLLIAIFYLIYDPSFDVIIINGKKKWIMWYDTANGRNWVFL